MLSEFERVRLVTDLPRNGLTRGATGTIVDIHHNPDAYMVEFTEGGKTVAVVAVNADQVERLHQEGRGARNIAAR
jgi:hypothetical protein